jgi:Cu+-exporting ATPase
LSAERTSSSTAPPVAAPPAEGRAGAKCAPDSGPDGARGSSGSSGPSGSARRASRPAARAASRADAALAEAALHGKRLLVTLGLAALIYSIERWAPASLWRPWASLSLGALALALGGEVIQNGFQTLNRARVNADSCAALGALVAFLGGAAATALMTLGRLSHSAFRSPEEARTSLTALGLHGAALLLALPHLGRFLEARAKARAIRSLITLRKLRPLEARVEGDQGEVEMRVERVRDGYRVKVPAGERIPVDGVVLAGRGLVDETILGSDGWVEKRPEDRVYAATLNGSEPLTLRARGPGTACAWHRALSIALEAQSTQAPRTPAESWATSSLSALGVTAATLIAATLWSAGFGYSLSITAALSALAAAWPGSLALAAPAGLHAGIARAARLGAVVRSVAILKRLAGVELALFAKTGTLTRARPRVAEVRPDTHHSADDIIFLATLLEIRSEHPIAGGILREGGRHPRTIAEVRGFRAIPGKGLRGQYQGKELLFGSLPLMRDAGLDTSPVAESHRELTARGFTPLALAWGGGVLGLVGMADEERSGSARVAGELRKMRIRSAILTGDCRGTAETLARKLGMDGAYPELSLAEKAGAVRAESAKGTLVAAIGHGVSDAPALAAADVGIALRAAEDLALEVAGGLVLGADPLGAVSLIRCARQAVARVRLVFAGAGVVSLGMLAAAAGFAALGRPLLPIWTVLAAAATTGAVAAAAAATREGGAVWAEPAAPETAGAAGTGTVGGPAGKPGSNV